MESSSGEPLLFYQLLGVKQKDHLVMTLAAEEKHLRGARETLNVTVRQTAKVLHYHQMKASLLEKYRAKQREAGEVEAKLQRLRHGSIVDDVGDNSEDGRAEGGNSSGGAQVLVNRQVEKRQRDKLAQLARNMADLRRKLVEEDKRERARRRKVRAKRAALAGQATSAGADASEQELYMEDWETMLTSCGEAEAEHYLACVHERRLEHEFLLQAVTMRMAELEARETDVVAKLAHQLKLLYRKTAFRYHPDRSENETATEMFQLLTKAYAVVSDTTKRRVYNDVANHTLYLCVHEQDEAELRMADIRDAKKVRERQKHQVLRITSGGPPRMPCPTVKMLTRGRVRVSWSVANRTHNVRVEVSMEEEDGNQPASTVYQGADDHCAVSGLKEGDYAFRVRAAFAAGGDAQWSEWSEPALVSVLEDGRMFNPESRSERAKWQQLKQEELREAKRLRRRRKEQRKRERRLREAQRSAAETMLLRCRRASQQLHRLIAKENVRDLERVLARLLAGEAQREAQDEAEAEAAEVGVEPEAAESAALPARLVVNWTNARGETPLVMASMRGVTGAVRALLDAFGSERGLLDFNCTDNQHGRTALIWAAVNDDVDSISALLRAGGDALDVNWQDYEGYTALHWAAELGNSHAVGALLRRSEIETGLETYVDGHTPLHMAAARGHALVVQLLHDKAVLLARRRDRDLVDVDKNVNNDDDTGDEDNDKVLSPAFLALMNEHYEVAQWLVRAEEWRLVQAGRPAAVRQLKTSLLHLAAMLDDGAAVMRACLVGGPHGADVDARDADGNTPLHLAYQVANANAVAFLRDEAGCRVDILNAKGLSPHECQLSVSDDDEADDVDEEDDNGDDDVDVDENDDDDDEVEDGDEDEQPAGEDDDEEAEMKENDEEEEKMPDECYMEWLPPEIMLKVLGFAYGRDACAMRAVSSAFREVAEDNLLWRTLFLRTFPFCFDAADKPTNWRTAFASQIVGKKRCAICSRVDQLRVCSGCRLVHYCGPEHQTIHWRASHMTACEGPFRMLPGVKRLIANERAEQRMKKALNIFALVELSLQSSKGEEEAEGTATVAKRAGPLSPGHSSRGIHH